MSHLYTGTDKRGRKLTFLDVEFCCRKDDSVRNRGKEGGGEEGRPWVGGGVDDGGRKVEEEGVEKASGNTLRCVTCKYDFFDFLSYYFFSF